MTDAANELLGVAALGLAAGITIYATRELIDGSHRHRVHKRSVQGFGLFRGGY